MNREIKAVSEAICKYEKGDIPLSSLSINAQMYYKEIAQAAIASSDSKYVKGLVEALWQAKAQIRVMSFDSCNDATEPTLALIEKALQQLPEDRR